MQPIGADLNCCCIYALITHNMISSITHLQITRVVRSCKSIHDVTGHNELIKDPCHYNMRSSDHQSHTPHDLFERLNRYCYSVRKN